MQQSNTASSSPAAVGASRQAGRKLALIVAVLCLPLLFLSYFLFKGSIAEIRAVKNQVAGISYLNDLTPILFSISRNDPATVRAGASRLSLQGQSESMVSSIKREQDAFVNQALREKFNQQQSLAEARDLFRHVASASGILMDGAVSRHFLADAYAKQFPDLLMLVSSADAGSDLFRGEFTTQKNIAFEALSTAIQTERTGNFAKLLNEPFSKFDNGLESFELALGSKSAAEKNAVLVNLMATTEKIMLTSGEALQWSLEDRLGALRRTLVLISLVCGLAVAVALSTAARMFYSTFHKLDDVEASRDRLTILNDSIAKLNRELAENFRVLKDTQDDNIQKSKMAQIGALTAMVAHELRNPLGAVRNSIFLIDRKARDAGLDLLKPAERINTAVQRCDNIISQLLEFTSQSPLQLGKVRMDDWVAEVVAGCASSVADDVFIRCELGVGELDANLDKGALKRAICAIIRNSNQAMQSAASNEGKELLVRTSLSGQFAKIEVIDNGPGITKENLDKVLEPLFTTKSFGPGLGLPIAKHIMEQHGGTLAVASEHGHGTAVTLQFPLSAAVALAA